MAKVSPGMFVNQVRSEASKVTWPTRKEVLITTIMVFVLTTLLATIFFLVDQVLGAGIEAFLNLTF
ncbi:MAG: preprotein translocase subunit SecE [Neomegalonema sp.]|nr:preprotein translocase subunit SecE [Neomegalonema sp.]